MTRPFIHVNVAMSADGKIDSALRKGMSISSLADRNRVDRLRASMDAVMVGGRTLIHEDPGLTVKSVDSRKERLRKGWPENPTKVGVVSILPFFKGGTSSELDGITTKMPLQNFLTSGPAQVYLFTTRRTSPEAFSAFQSEGATVLIMGEERVDLAAVLGYLHEIGIRSILVEGGGTLISDLFHHNLVDEMTIYLAPMILGGDSAPTLADGVGFPPEQAIGLKLETVTRIDQDGGILIHYLVLQKE
jgi:2,5-diamino-6-(ribosylamino)-4(3H)-pyrimidinone 5'-phosphate reductase